ncbi:MAG: iron-containing alcohol dehydrogenase [Haloarculaceae archaeon]
MSQFRAPARYVQGEGVLDAAGDHLDRIDATAAVVAGGETALATAGAPLSDGLADAGVDHVGTVRGISQSTDARIADVIAAADEGGADLVVGVGGCTAIDAAKAAAIRGDRSFVAVPTLASADGPAGGVAVVYDEAGGIVDVELAARDPELVLVDTGVVAAAPTHFLRWGLGDSLATVFEAEACAQTGARTIHGEETAPTGLALARETYRVIREHGEQALADVERGAVTPAVEAVVENTHLTSVLGWENGGLAGAHALETGLRASGITEPPHGPLVAICTLAELVWQDHERREEVATLLAALDFADPIPDGADVRAGAAVACDLPMMAHEPVAVDPETATAALETARDALDAARA